MRPTANASQSLHSAVRRALISRIAFRVLSMTGSGIAGVFRRPLGKDVLRSADVVLPDVAKVAIDRGFDNDRGWLQSRRLENRT